MKELKHSDIPTRQPDPRAVVDDADEKVMRKEHRGR
jgi:hypothetical protein